MAALGSTVTIKNSQYRPCFVNDKKALFHKWEIVMEIVPPSPMMGGHAGGQISSDFAIVEYEDGTVAQVNPNRIKFVDGLIKEYSFDMKDVK